MSKVSRRHLLLGALGTGAAVPLLRQGSAVAAVSESSEIPFDGGPWAGTDAQKWAAMVAWLKSVPPTAPRPAVRFPARRIVTTQPLPTVTGHRFHGTGIAREFGTGTTIDYRGTAPFFQIFRNAAGYSYPSNGVPRDISFDGIQFQAGTGVPFFEPTAGYDPAKVLWYVNFNDCGWVGWRGGKLFGTGFGMTGLCHLQAVTSTWAFAGSECHFFGDNSLVDSSDPSWLAAGRPFFEMFGEKWTMGSVMISARQSSYQLLVSGGHQGECDGTYFDSPDGAATRGAQVRVTGGDGLLLRGCCFKGGGGILVRGGRDIAIEGCRFYKGQSEVLRVESTFTGRVLLGLNSWHSSIPKVVRVARLNQITSLDPRVAIHDLSGNVLRPAA